MNRRHLESKKSTMDQHRDRKLRLNKMRERTKALLRNHDWEKFFPNTIELNESPNNHLNCSLSAINHLDYDSLLMQTNVNVNQNQNKPNSTKIQLNLMPFLINTSCQKTISKGMRVQKASKGQTLAKVKRFKQDKDQGDDDYQLNMIPQIVRPSPRARSPGRHHQSLTFIADLAQTSTPTRTCHQPITSTPKHLTHDPLKYHPTQTIRSKKTMTSSSTGKRARISLKREEKCVKCVVGVKTTSNRNKRKRADSISVVGHQSGWECELCNLSRAVSSIGDAAMASACTKKKSRVKFKTSNIEISLQDLLYAPAKINKFELVTTSRPRVRKQQSKVYYL